MDRVAVPGETSLWSQDSKLHRNLQPYTPFGIGQRKASGYVTITSVDSGQNSSGI
jgi:hypothetical protein